MCTSASADIAKIVMLDAARIQEEDARLKRERHRREGRRSRYPEVPLYTEDDANAVLPLFSPVEYERRVEICQGIEASFHDAGHILGSAMIKVFVRDRGVERVLLFSGDVGRWQKPILRDPTVFAEADYVCVETTYGDRMHERSDDLADRLAAVINRTQKAGGNVVIPSFAVGRTQEIMYYLNQLLMQDRIPHLMVFIDSPMAVKVTEVFKRHVEMFDRETVELLLEEKSPFGFPNLKLVSSVGESKAINHIRGTAIIIAGSGMCTGGRVKHHLVNNIDRSESTILFVGYQAVGTLGRHIVEGSEEVRIMGQTFPVHAELAQLEGFSSHADREELWKWLSGLHTAPKGVFLTHGEPKAAQAFSDLLTERTQWPVMVPRYREQVTLA